MTIGQRPRPFAPALVLLLSLLATAPVSAQQIELAGLFGDHMVLQAHEPVVIWGTAAPREPLRLTMGEASVSGYAGATGRFSLSLPAFEPGGPYELVLSGRDKANQVLLQDLLVGEVWIAAGGANMALPVSMAGDALETVRAAHHSRLRVTQLPARAATSPQLDASLEWQAISPRTVLNVSATAYAFAVELQQALAVPVGVIQVTAPFTNIAPWVPDQALRADSRLGHVVSRTDSLVAAHRAALPEHLESLEAWLDDVEAAVNAGADVPATPAVPVHPLATGSEAGSLFAGMVAPLTPLAVAGVLWHQGERDLGKGASYAVLQEALVKGWRAAWRRPKLPWLSVQLPPYRYGGHRPTEKPEYEVDPHRLPELWEAQARLLDLPHTGLVGTSDLGQLDEMFFPERRILGRRLSHWALARCYGKSRVYWGPTFASATAGGPLGDLLGGELSELASVRVSFHGAAGLSTRDGARPDWWELSSDGDHFVVAQARLDGQAVRVWSPDVPQPLVVRYGWHQEARGNLVNGAGLPAMPFRASVR